MKHSKTFLLLFLFLFALLLTPTAFAQQRVQTDPDCVIAFDFTAAGSTPAFDNRSAVGNACISWTLTYASTGFSADSIEFQQASDNGGVAGAFVTWVTLPSGTTLPLTATTEGQASGFRYHPFVRVTVNSVTGTGRIVGRLIGWRALSGQDASGAGSTTVTVSGNVTVVQPTGTNLHTVCDSGCSSSTFADSSAFTFATTPISNTGFVVDDVATNTVAENSSGTPRMNTNRILYIDLSKSVANTNKFLVTADPITFASAQAVTQSGNWTTRIVGNAGGIVDTTQNAAQTANNISIGCAFTSTPNTITTANQGAVNCNSKGELLTQVTDGVTNASVIAATAALKTDMSSIAGTATATAAAGVQKVGIVGNANAAVDAAIGAAPPANAIYIAGIVSGATGGLTGGTPICDSYANINISTITTTLVITGVSGRQVRICSFHLANNAADNVAWLEGTGATCGTGTAGMAGGTTAASGYNFGANSGMTIGGGLGTVMRTATAGDSVCIITSATTQLSGGVSYAIY